MEEFLKLIKESPERRIVMLCDDSSYTNTTFFVKNLQTLLIRKGYPETSLISDIDLISTDVFNNDSYIILCHKNNTDKLFNYTSVVYQSDSVYLVLNNKIHVVKSRYLPRNMNYSLSGSFFVNKMLSKKINVYD